MLDEYELTDRINEIYELYEAKAYADFCKGANNLLDGNERLADFHIIQLHTYVALSETDYMEASFHIDEAERHYTDMTWRSNKGNPNHVAQLAWLRQILDKARAKVWGKDYDPEDDDEHDEDEEIADEYSEEDESGDAVSNAAPLAVPTTGQSPAQLDAAASAQDSPTPDLEPGLVSPHRQYPQVLIRLSPSVASCPVRGSPGLKRGQGLLAKSMRYPFPLEDPAISSPRRY